MNRNIRILAASLVALNLVLMPTYAAGQSPVTAPVTAPATKEVYTYEKAAELAIKQNFELKTSLVDRAKLGRQIDDTLNNVYSMAARGEQTFSDRKDSTDPLIDNLIQLQNSVASSDDNVALKRAALKDTIKALFVTIDKAELQLKNMDQQIALDEKKIQSDRVKVKVGKMSAYDLENSYNTNLKNIRSREAMAINIAKLYDSLKNYMGIDVKTNIALDYGFIDQYAVVMPGYESGISKMNSNNLKLTTYAADLKRAQNARADIRSRYPSGTTSGSNADLDMDKAELTYNNAVKELPYKYETAYNDIKDAYQSYYQKERELQVKKMDLKNGAVKFKLGRMSQLDYTTLETETKMLENDFSLSRIAFVSACLALESTINGTN